jgi:histidine triad (HIT) family protein
MDINPAAKGHLLIMTKEHYPILPVIPLDTAAQMFRITKHLSKALKQAMVTDKATIFIANGAVAGQQSPHFLYHIIPRENGDNLDNFNIPANEFKEEEVKQHLVLFKGKIGLMMRQFKAKRGGAAHGATAATPKPVANEAEKPSEIAQRTESQPTSPKEPGTYKGLAEFIDKNPKIKELIIKAPEAFKLELESNPGLKKLFTGINISKLSEALKKIVR